MAFFKFDATAVAPQMSMGPVPAGNYISHIIESDLIDLKSGNGQGLKLKFEIIDGEFKGRKIFETLNVVHTNEDTQRIAQSQLSSICRAIGVNNLTDTAVLHFKPMKLTVEIQPAKGDFKESNRIKGYEAANAAAKPAAAAPATAAPAANGSAPAWAKKAA